MSRGHRGGIPLAKLSASDLFNAVDDFESLDWYLSRREDGFRNTLIVIDLFVDWCGPTTVLDATWVSLFRELDCGELPVHFLRANATKILSSLDEYNRRVTEKMESEEENRQKQRSSLYRRYHNREQETRPLIAPGPTLRLLEHLRIGAASSKPYILFIRNGEPYDVVIGANVIETKRAMKHAITNIDVESTRGIGLTVEEIDIDHAGNPIRKWTVESEIDPPQESTKKYSEKSILFMNESSSIVTVCGKSTLRKRFRIVPESIRIGGNQPYVFKLEIEEGYLEMDADAVNFFASVESSKQVSFVDSAMQLWQKVPENVEIFHVPLRIAYVEEPVVVRFNEVRGIVIENNVNLPEFEQYFSSENDESSIGTMDRKSALERALSISFPNTRRTIHTADPAMLSLQSKEQDRIVDISQVQNFDVASVSSAEEDTSIVAPSLETEDTEAPVHHDEENSSENGLPNQEMNESKIVEQSESQIDHLEPVFENNMVDMQDTSDEC